MIQSAQMGIVSSHKGQMSSSALPNPVPPKATQAWQSLDSTLGCWTSIAYSHMERIGSDSLLHLFPGAQAVQSQFDDTCRMHGQIVIRKAWLSPRVSGTRFDAKAHIPL